MGRMTYWMNVSLDLRIERSASDHVADEEGGEWLRIDEQLFREFNERARGLALLVEGRIIYEMMETRLALSCTGRVAARPPAGVGQNLDGRTEDTGLQLTHHRQPQHAHRRWR
jgi:hypothetical protein